jgi:hypothetical protein
VAGAAGHDPLRGLYQVRLFAELARFRIVQSHQVDVLQKLDNVRPPALNPEVHRIARYQLRFSDLLEDIELQPRIDIGQEHIRQGSKRLGDLRAEA